MQKQNSGSAIGIVAEIGASHPIAADSPVPIAQKSMGEIGQKYTLDQKGESLLALQKQLEEALGIPIEYKESAHLKARKKRVAKQSKQTEQQMELIFTGEAGTT